MSKSGSGAGQQRRDVGTDAKLMNLAIKVAPRRAIRFVQKQMSKHLVGR